MLSLRQGVVWVVTVGALLAVSGVLGVGADRAGAQTPVTVVVTGADLNWPEGTLGSATWGAFGRSVSEDPECAAQGIGGVITSVRFEFSFDLSADPAILTGTLSGSGDWRNPTDDPAYGQEWSSFSFAGVIVGGWARETAEGWRWGGTADLALEFAGAVLCDIDLDEWQEEVHQFADGSGQRPLTVEFSGGCFGGGYHGFSLFGDSRPDGGTGEPGEDVWYMAMGCTGCDIPLPPPVSSGCLVGGSGSAAGSDSASGFMLPPWLQPGVVGAPPVGDEGEAGAQPTGGSGRWDPLGVALLVLFMALLVLGVLLTRRRPLPEVREAVQEASAVALLEAAFESGELREGLPSPPTAEQTSDLARRVVQDPAGEGTPVTPSSPVQPWSSPDEGSARAGFVLQPGEPGEEMASTGAGPDAWVQVRQANQSGWVHRSTLEDWHQETISRPAPPGWGGPYRWATRFPDNFLTRDPGGTNLTRQPPGEYGVGPPDADGFRPVYDSEGKLIGNIPADQVPPQPVYDVGGPGGPGVSIPGPHGDPYFMPHSLPTPPGTP